MNPGRFCNLGAARLHPSLAPLRHYSKRFDGYIGSLMGPILYRPSDCKCRLFWRSRRFVQRASSAYTPQGSYAIPSKYGWMRLRLPLCTARCICLVIAEDWPTIRLLSRYQFRFIQLLDGISHYMESTLIHLLCTMLRRRRRCPFYIWRLKVYRDGKTISEIKRRDDAIFLSCQPEQSWPDRSSSDIYSGRHRAEQDHSGAAVNK